MSELESVPEEYESKAAMDFSKYFLADDLSDILIVCGRETFPAHRIVLGGIVQVRTQVQEYNIPKF